MDWRCASRLVPPVGEVALHGRARWEAAAQQVEDGVDDVAQGGRLRPSQGLGRRHIGCNRPHSASLKSLAWRRSLRSYCGRVISVHMLYLADGLDIISESQLAEIT